MFTKICYNVNVIKKEGKINMEKLFHNFGKVIYKGETITLLHEFKYNYTFYEFKGINYSTLRGAKIAVTKYLKKEN